MTDVILKTTSIQDEIVNFKKHLPIVSQTSKAFYGHQYSADFIYFISLARDLFLHSWLTFRENVLIDDMPRTEKSNLCKHPAVSITDDLATI